MTILVDELIDWPGKGLWCHMVSDLNVDELHQFAAQIGLRRSWFQGQVPRHPHYDLRPTVRATAIAAGAREVTSDEMIQALGRVYGGPAA
jgi:hypothetical protein